MGEDQPLCRDYNPELWFPVPYDFRLTSGPKRLEAMNKALFALTICDKCPLSKTGKCLDIAFEDISTVDYGIYGGTLAHERRIASESFTQSSDGHIWQQDIRREADKIGIVKPLIGKRKRPESRYYLMEETA